MVMQNEEKKKEPSSNVRLFCAKHAPKPDPKLVKRPLEAFVGTCVKKAFPVHGNSKVDVEHMWVDVVEIEDGRLVGTLNNHPVFNVGVEFGDRVTVELDEIEAVDERSKP